MRTTLDIDSKLLEGVVEETGEKNKSKAVSRALEEYIRARKIDQFRAVAGKMDIVDNWRELEELEVRRQRELES